MVQKKIQNHLSGMELDELIKSYKKDCKMYKKLVLIKSVKDGKKISDACYFLQISEPTGHRWVDQYNDNGLAGLKPRHVNAGRPSKLSKEQKEELCKIVENEEYLTIQRAHKIIKDRYGVDYSLKQVKRIMTELEFNYGKPFQIYAQKPKDAELQLKKT